MQEDEGKHTHIEREQKQPPHFEPYPVFFRWASNDRVFFGGHPREVKLQSLVRGGLAGAPRRLAVLRGDAQATDRNSPSDPTSCPLFGEPATHLNPPWRLEVNK